MHEGLCVVRTCCGLGKSAIRSTTPMITMFESSFETITVGTDMETGPNHEPTMYSTEARPIRARLAASSTRCVHLRYGRPSFDLYSGKARHMVEVTSSRPPSAERPMHAGSDGSKERRSPPPLSVRLPTMDCERAVTSVGV